MTNELLQIRDEIAALPADAQQLELLEGLVNNAIYLLSKLERHYYQKEFIKQKTIVENVMGDLLQTLNKELRWAAEEGYPPQKLDYYEKAQQQVLKDLALLFPYIEED